MNSEDNTTSYKGEKRKNYTMETKREAMTYTEMNSNNKAAKKFGVAAKRIREWIQNKPKIIDRKVKAKSKRLEGGGVKPMDLQLENQLVEWIYGRRFEGLRVSRRLIMTKANSLYNESCDEHEKTLFLASTGWLKKLGSTEWTVVAKKNHNCPARSSTVN